MMQNSFYTFLGPKCEPGPSKAEKDDPMADLPHFQNWVAASRARDHKILNADIEEGHKSMVLCLLARAAYQLGRPVLKFNPRTETIVGDDEANGMLNEPGYREPYVVPKEV